MTIPTWRERLGADPSLGRQLVAMQVEIDELRKENDAWRRIIRDCFNDAECLPTCDSLGHDPACPIADAANRIAELQAALATSDREILRIQNEVLVLEDKIKQCVTDALQPTRNIIATYDPPTSPNALLHDQVFSVLQRFEAKLATIENAIIERCANQCRYHTMASDAEKAILALKKEG